LKGSFSSAFFRIFSISPDRLNKVARTEQTLAEIEQELASIKLSGDIPTHTVLGVQEKVGSYRATLLSLSGEIEKIRKKADEKDPFKQTYGPAMKKKVLTLCGKYDEVSKKLNEIGSTYDKLQHTKGIVPEQKQESQPNLDEKKEDSNDANERRARAIVDDAKEKEKQEKDRQRREAEALLRTHHKRKKKRARATPRTDASSSSSSTSTSSSASTSTSASTSSSSSSSQPTLQQTSSIPTQTQTVSSFTDSYQKNLEAEQHKRKRQEEEEEERKKKIIRRNKTERTRASKTKRRRRKS